MNEFKWLIENVPVAGGLIIMTRMWLTYLRDEGTANREVIRSITTDFRQAITDNTDALASLKGAVEKQDVK